MDRTEDSEQRRVRFFASTCELPKNSVKIKKKKGKVNQKKGFSDEQIKSLETVFESETKPEPKKKEEIAAELGLQPRQVAIWFQNRRARWKSKQVEQDYVVLKASYDGLVAEFEALQKEKQDLMAELQRLRDLLGKTVPADGNAISEEHSRKDDSVHENGERETDPVSLNRKEPDMCGSRCGNVGISVEDGFQLLNMKEEALVEDGSLRLLSFEPNGTSDYSLSSTAWWNFWA